ncbi:MAG: tRNA (adenosine(37)-N6)-dimethylallyltransferase MiaA [Muribaculaceae bacterium]|nr:tRNA (adenosine(37)-N6)-dimethylallyltransferase MiaA [Muribaculaceae bacterium]
MPLRDAPLPAGAELTYTLLPAAGKATGRAIVITGPTAGGKTALALDTASRRGLHIINADSRQVYHGIPIVTAMPAPEELASVPHHLIDMLPLEAYYSAARFEQDALAVARRQIAERGEVIVCGGSMMYVDSFCRGIDALPDVPDDIRRATYDEWRVRGDDWALGELLRLDPEYHVKVDRRNMKRVVHALEIIRASGRTYTSLRTGKRKPREFDIELWQIRMPRELLFSRINSRVDAMVAAGLEEEARRVYPMRGLNSLNTVGLKEMFAWFDGEMDRLTAIERIKKNTRVYAKKQLIWKWPSGA